MGNLSLIFIVLMAPLSSFGSLIPTSHSPPDSPDSVWMTQSANGKIGAKDVLTHEEFFNSEINSDAVEASGHSADSIQKTKLSDSYTEISPSHGAGDSRNLERLIFKPSFLSFLLGPQNITKSNVNPKEPNQVMHKNQSGSGTTLTTTPAVTPTIIGSKGKEIDKSITSATETSNSSFILEKSLFEDSRIRDVQFTMFMENDSFITGLSPEGPVQTQVFTSMSQLNPSGPGRPCVLGHSPCVVPANINSTSLIWDDMRRTLTFAWELHVFGFATLFILMACLAVLGVAGAWTLLHPLCDALTVANTLLIVIGTLRAAFLLLDPYGTRQILSLPTLAALYNAPLQLLLWVQVALSLVTFKELKVILFSLQLQLPWVVGGLAVSHCTLLLVADILSPTLTPTLPLLLQTLSLCWGLPSCLEILTMSLTHLRAFITSSAPQRLASQKTENSAKRITAMCALLGVLCCSLQMYSLLWLYGLLGNWRRFGWVWWLCQFWARILELAWGFSLLVLGSWFFWTPTRGYSRGGHVKRRGKGLNWGQETNLWGRALTSFWKGSRRKSEKTWEDLMPNNWARYKLSRTGISNNIMSPYDDQSCTIISEYNPEPLSNGSCDSQPALLWQNVGERECILSLVEFDIAPPSPINLRRSIDDALHQGHLVAELFKSSPPMQNVGTGDGHGGKTIFPPPFFSGKMLDTESVSASLDHFQAKESMQSQTSAADDNGSTGPSNGGHLGDLIFS